MVLNCLIVDDEPLARKQLESYVSRLPFLKLVGIARNPAVAASLLENSVIDLIFLDIEMPGITGIVFLKNTQLTQQVILVTAYPQYAVEGFELEVADYLLKPVTFERFERACGKALQNVNGDGIVRSLKNQPGNLYIKCDQRLQKVPVDQILYIEAMANYVHIILPGQKLTVYSSLGAMESRLPPGEFIRTHKSFLAAVKHIDTVTQHKVTIGSYHVPVSRMKRKIVEEIWTAQSQK